MNLMESPTAQDFYRAMCDHYESETGFHPQDAADVGIRMRALARELHRLGQQMEQVCADAFPQSATGAALELHAQARGLSRGPAGAATGTLRFTRLTPGARVEIPAGTLCSNREGDLRFETLAAGEIPAGETAAELLAGALAPGEAGNVARGTVCVLLAGVPGVAGVNNPAAFTGGAPAESDEELRARLLAELATPADAANAAFYRNTAKAHPGVRSVALLPRVRGMGTLDVAIACKPGYDADQVAEEVQEALDAAREVGTHLLVMPALEVEAAVAAHVVTAPGANPTQIAEDCAKALTGYIAALEIGAPLRLTRLTGCLLNVAGVENFRILTPGTDLIPAAGQVVTPGEIAVGRVASL